MRITNLRKNNVKLTQVEMNNLMEQLRDAIKAKGFITDVNQLTSSSINLGLHMKSFVVDTNVLGYNKRVNSYTRSRMKKGYKKTNVPTWTQREDYNNIINWILTNNRLTATVKSGPYLIRDSVSGPIHEWDPYLNHNTSSSHEPSVLEIQELED